VFTTSLKAERPATVLLITASELKESWESFAEWKTKIGKPTTIVTVDEISKKYKAEGIQEKIRLCVRDHIDNHGTKFVLLGGDSLPGGTGLVPGGHTTVHQQEPAGIPTDIVYLSPKNWDADGDGIYGEWEDDQDAIVYPDGSIALGRVPVRTADDVAAFTDKVITYESSYPTGTFAQKMIYTCTDSPAYPKVRRSWDDHVSKAWPETSVQRFFNTESPWDEEDKPGSYDLSANNLVKLFNQKSVGKLHIHGHGLLPLWVLENSKFTGKDVAKLKNDGAYPLITTVSCNTGEYDSKKDPSIVEAMLRAPKAGSVAIVAPVRTGKPHFHKRSDFRLMVTEGKLDGTTMTMTRYWKNGASLSTGHSLMKAKSEMEEDARKTPGYHLCICELNLLGDPTLEMRGSPPKTPSINVVDEIKTGKQTIQIKTNSPDCNIQLWKNEELYISATADKKGIAKIEIEPKKPGDLHVALTGQGMNYVTKTVNVE